MKHFAEGSSKKIQQGHFAEGAFKKTIYNKHISPKAHFRRRRKLFQRHISQKVRYLNIYKRRIFPKQNWKMYVLQAQFAEGKFSPKAEHFSKAHFGEGTIFLKKWTHELLKQPFWPTYLYVWFHLIFCTCPALEFRTKVAHSVVHSHSAEPLLIDIRFFFWENMGFHLSNTCRISCSTARDSMFATKRVVPGWLDALEPLP